MNVRPEQGMGALTVVNVTVTVKVSLHIRACGKGRWAVRGIPSCSCIRQQCGQTLHSVPIPTDVSGPQLYITQHGMQ